MYLLILILTGAVIVGGALYAFHRTRDAFHPAIIVAPPLAFVYSLWPMVLNADGELEWLVGTEALVYVAWLYFLAIVTLYLGLLRLPRRRQLRFIRQGLGRKQNLFVLSLTPALRKRLFYLALGLGLVAVAAYAHMIGNVGGLVEAYSRVKGGGRAASGYIGEAILLSFPAILLLAIARQGVRRIRLTDVFLALLIASPHLLQGTLGGRRGPLFLILAVLFLAWFIARGRVPSLKAGLAGLLAIGFAMILVQSQRQDVYIGSEGQFDLSRVMDVISPEENLETNDYVAGVATVLTVDFYNDYYWGHRYFVTVFIRPIPRQIWPTKYEDVGAHWITRFDADQGGADYLEAIGFRPPRGSAIGFIADIYHEFYWGVLLATFLFGRGLAALWKRHSLRGGLWTVLFVEAMILSVYLPTQSFSAWFHRFLFMAIISTLVWKYWVEQGSRRPRKAPEHAYEPIPPPHR